eukprot:COSAG01_NODE_10232_length_2215_cov_1.685728_2_plen_64_part_00
MLEHEEPPARALARWLAAVSQGTDAPACPAWIMEKASPIACAPVVHAVLAQWLGPRSPCRIDR